MPYRCIAAPSQGVMTNTQALHDKMQLVAEQVHGISAGQKRLESILNVLQRDVSIVIGNFQMSSLELLPQDNQADDEQSAMSNDASNFTRPTIHSNENGGTQESKKKSARDCGQFNHYRLPQVRHGIARIEITSEREGTSRSLRKLMDAFRNKQTLTLYHSQHHWRCQWRALHPSSHFILIRDMLTFLVLFCDSIVIPYQLGLNASGTWLTKYYQATFAFWLVDMYFSFVTGYYSTTEVVQDLGKVASHYLKTQWAFDSALLIADFLILQFHSSWMARWVKFLRVMKLQRLYKAWQMLYTAKHSLLPDRLMSLMRRFGLVGTSTVILRIMQLLILILWLNHLGCCVWSAVESTAISNWLAASQGQSRRHTMTDDVYVYLIGYYWSLTSMVSGASIMTPISKGELTFTIVFILFGLIFGSSLISTLAAMLVEFQMAENEYKSQMHTLRKYLAQKKVPMKVAVPVEDEVRRRLNTKPPLTERDVAVMTILPPKLRSELRCCLYGKGLLSHPFMRSCASVDDEFLEAVCANALCHSIHNTGDRIFEPDSNAVATYYICWGELEYQRLAEHGHAPPRKFATTGHWISMMALWVDWDHKGWLQGETACELLSINVDSFLKVVSGHQEAAMLAKDYSTALCQAITLDADAALNLDDLDLGVDFESVVVSMPAASRFLMSKPALDLLPTQMYFYRFRKHIVNELLTEVSEGKCDLMVTLEERVLRSVSVVAIECENSEGEVLAQIAKWMDGQAPVAECKLVGTKVKGGELPSHVLARLLNCKLRSIAEGIQVLGKEVVVDERPSKAYGVTTKYIRTVFRASVNAQAMQVMQSLHNVDIETRPSFSDSMPSVSLDHRHCFALPHYKFKSNELEGSCSIFAWLRKSEFDLLTSPSGDPELQRWVQKMRLSNCVEEHCCTPPLLRCVTTDGKQASQEGVHSNTLTGSNCVDQVTVHI